MPYDDPDATDPMTLHGVAFETTDDSTIREMASCFIEEYLRMGFDRERILRMFQSKGYAGPHLAYETLGDERICAMIDDAARIWGGREKRDDAVQTGRGRVSLPIIEPSIDAQEMRS